MPEDECEGLLGFSVHRTDHTENKSFYIKGMKAFAETDPGFPAGSFYSTQDHPVQSFQWADYSAKPGYNYTYLITALKGSPQQLTPYASVNVTVDTEWEESGDHDIYFNRGVAASQEYMRRFGNRPPDKVPDDKAYAWLSRGLFEAMEAYIRECEPGRDALRIAAYEFNYSRVLELIKEVSEGGVDIQVVYDARKDVPGAKNRQTIQDAGLSDVCIPRTQGKSYISHNKFIVKLRDDQPISVLTGGTNFSEGGIFGHSNVAHMVEDEVVAADFFRYWQLLAQDPTVTATKKEVNAISAVPELPLSAGITTLFSPRNDLTALQFYADLAQTSQEGLFMTFAFGMNDLFKEVYKTSGAPFRMALLEKKTRPMKDGPEKQAEEAELQELRNLTENFFAVGNFVATNKFEGWVKEKLSGLNKNVNYVHNKFMLIDPLSDNPVVVSGSANFSAASITKNDENMLIIKGNTQVADIYLGEFMRMYSHFSFRESLQWRSVNEPPKPLNTGKWWEDSFGDTPRSSRRKFFARVST